MNQQQRNSHRRQHGTHRGSERWGRRRLMRRKSRTGSVELEAVLITGLMFPLAVALYYMAIRGFAMLYQLIAGILEWPYL